MVLPLMPSSGPMHVNTRFPSEIEVMTEIGFLKMYIGAGSGGLSPSLMNGIGVLTSELTSSRD